MEHRFEEAAAQSEAVTREQMATGYYWLKHIIRAFFFTFIFHIIFEYLIAFPQDFETTVILISYGSCVIALLYIHSAFIKVGGTIFVNEVSDAKRDGPLAWGLPGWGEIGITMFRWFYLFINIPLSLLMFVVNYFYFLNQETLPLSILMSLAFCLVPALVLTTLPVKMKGAAYVKMVITLKKD
jgi:hypothetical protein